MRVHQWDTFEKRADSEKKLKKIFWHILLFFFDLLFYINYYNFSEIKLRGYKFNGGVPPQVSELYKDCKKPKNLKQYTMI